MCTTDSDCAYLLRDGYGEYCCMGNETCAVDLSACGGVGCGDATCDEGETEKNCPVDCTLVCEKGDGICSSKWYEFSWWKS
jgi:hypothetical protein